MARGLNGGEGFSVAVHIERQKGKNDQFKQIVAEVDDFIKYVQNNPIELNVSSTKKTISQIEQLQEAVRSLSASAHPEDLDFSAGLSDAIREFDSFFESVTVGFKNLYNNERIYVTGLEDITRALANTDIAPIFTDASGAFEYARLEADRLLDTIEAMGNIKRDRWSGNLNFFSGDFDTDELRDYIYYLKELRDQQETMLNFDPTMRERDFASGHGVDYLNEIISDREDMLQQMRDLRIQTTKELDLYKELKEGARAGASSWDDDLQAESKKSFGDQAEYQRSIRYLKEYIEEKEALLQQLKEHSYLFDYDSEGLQSYVDRVENSIKVYKTYLEDLQNYKGGSDSGSVGGNFSEVVEVLQRVEQAIRDIKVALDPLSTAFTTEGTALNRMATEGAASLDTLTEKLKELNVLMETLSQKDFNITNIVNQKGNVNESVNMLKEKAKVLLDINKQLMDAQSGIYRSNNALYQKAIRSSDGAMTGALFELQGFKPEELYKKIIKSGSEAKLMEHISTLEYYKDMLLQIVKSINNIAPNSIDTSILSNLDKIDQTDLNKSVTEQADSSAQALSKESDKLKEVKVEAEAAASAKEEFTAANKAVKIATETSTGSLKEESAALQKVADSADETEGELKSLWTTAREGGSLKELNLPTVFEGESGQDAVQMFAKIKSELEELTGHPVKIDFTSTPNQDGELEAVRATLKYINEEAGITVTQFYDIARSGEGLESVVVATQSAEKATIAATKAAKAFNAELQQKLAFAQIKTLEEQMGSLKIDLTDVYKAANAIGDKASLDDFNLELKVARELLSQMKSQLKGQNTLDPVIAAERRLETLNTELDTLRIKFKLLSDTDVGFIADELTGISEAYEHFENAKSTEAKLLYFKSIIQALAQVKAEMTNLNQLIKLQDQLYKDKKALVTADPNKETTKVLRENIEAQEAALNVMLEGSQHKATMKQREIALEKELGAVIEDNNKKQAKVQENKEEQELQKAISLQDKLYKLKKEQVNLEDGSAAHQEKQRRIDEAQQEYDAYVDLISVADNYYTIKEREATLEGELATVQEEYEWNKKNTEVKQEQLAIEQELAAAKKEADGYYKEQQEAVKPYINDYQKEADALTEIETKLRAISTYKEGSGSPLATSVAEYRRAVEELEIAKNAIVNNPNDDKLQKPFQDAALAAQNAQSKVNGVFKEIDAFQEKSKSWTLLGRSLEISPNVTDNFNNLKMEMLSFAAQVTNGKFELQGFNEATGEMHGTVTKAGGAVEEITIALDKGTSELKAFQTGTKQVGNEWQKVGSALGNGIKRLAVMYGSFYDIIRYVRKGVQAVREIDAALTELKKVTDETEESYAKFLDTASQRAGEIGSTIKDFTQVTSDFARLGYSLQEATELAETALVYENVGDGFSSVDEASESVISTMKAFGIAAEDAMGIVDRFNIVGNNFAITSKGIGDALQKSASALYEAGNTLDESIALVTAANSVVQNPEQVGTALKTLSLRLRGAKVDLEEAGLETDGMASSVSTLREKLLALTGGKVDIMIDENTFKNTTEILREMSTVWEDMTDISQAAALELMGGKRQANILSSIISNFETVEEVIDKSMNSSGSAMAENQKYLESIQGHVDIFNNAMQTFWNNLINSEVIKTFVDFGTDVMKFLDTVPGKLTAIVGIIAGVSKLKGFSLGGLFASLGSSMKELTTAHMALQGLSGITFNTQSIQSYAAAVANLTAKQQAAMLASAGLSKQQIQLVMQANNIEQAKIREATAYVLAKNSKEQEMVVDQASLALSYRKQATQLAQLGTAQAVVAATEAGTIAQILETQTDKEAIKTNLLQAVTEGKVSAAKANEILVTLGLAGANTTLAGTFKALTAAIASNPFGLLLVAIPLLISGLSKVIKTSKELKEEVESLTSNYQSAINDINSSLKSLSVDDTSVYKTLEQEFRQLTEGVDKYGNNISLTSDEYERYQEICEKICEINPELAAGYDSVTEAIGNNANILSVLIEQQEMALRGEALEYTSDKNLKKIAKDAINDYEDAVEEINTYYASHPDHGLVKVLLTEAYKGISWDYGNKQTQADDIAKQILEDIGMSPDKINEALQQYINGDNFDFYGFVQDYADQISENAQVLPKAIQVWANSYKSAQNKLEHAQEGFIYALTQVPLTLDEYSELSNSEQSFIMSWIKNSGQFEIKDGDKKGIILEYKQQIQDMILGLANSDYVHPTTGYSMQNILDSIFSIDASQYNWHEYVDEINTLINYAWEAIGAEGNTLGFKTKEDFAQIFGFDLDTIKKDLNETTNQLKEWVGDDADELLKYIRGLTAEEVQAFLRINWNVLGSDKIQGIDDVKREFENSLVQDFDVSTYTGVIDGIQGNISSWQSALEKIQEGTFTNGDFLDLVQEYPEILDEVADSVDLTSGNFEGLDSVLSKLIKNAPDEFTKELLKMREQLVKAGKSTDAIDAIIEATKNLPSDAVKNFADQYITLTEEINGAMQAQNELEEALSGEDSNKGYQTRAEAIEEMISLMEKGAIGSESKLWDIAKAFGFEYDYSDTLNNNANALAKFIQLRKEWYDFGEDGDQYSAEGILNFVEYAEDQIGNSDIWSFENGALKIDFDNQSWDEIAAQIGITSDEFFDLMMQIGQFYDLKWENADDIITYLQKMSKEGYSAAERLNTVQDTVEAILSEHNLTTDWLTGPKSRINGINFQDLPEEVRKVLQEYWKIQDEVKSDPLSIKWKLDQDSADELSEETIETLQEVTNVITDNNTGISFIDGDTLRENAKDAGYTAEAIDEIIDRVKEYNDVIVLETSEDDPLGLISLKDNTEAAIGYLTNLGIATEEVNFHPRIDLPDLVQVLQSKGWDAAQVQAYVNTLTEQGYTFAIDGVTLDIDTNADGVQQEIEDCYNTVKTAPDEEIKVDLTGNAESTLKSIVGYLSQITDKEVNVTVHETKYVVTKPGATRVDGTAHAQGTAYKGGSWGAPRTETALVGELGPEMRVRDGRWELIGENGAEFTGVKKGDIIFNHKQTEALLSKGYVVGRGKAYAGGTAYSDATGAFTKFHFGDDGYTTSGANALSSAADDISDAADEFREVFDWIEVRLEEINEQLDLKNAQLENAVGYTDKNQLIDEIIKGNEILRDNLLAGAKEYYAYSEKLLAKVPEEYRKAAQDGTIAIEEFVGEVDEKTLESIEEYREWVQKGADATQQAEEVLTEISSLAKQAIDNIAEDYENKMSLSESRIDQLDAYNELTETTYGSESEKIYKAIIEANKTNRDILKAQRDAMQDELNAQVEAGNIKKNSQDWYDAVNAIAEVDTQIIELNTDINDLQDSINELHWDHFDNLMERLEDVSDEADNLIDILSVKDVVDEMGNWTDEGITSLGLYAQQMEAAEVQAKKYQDEIDYLNKNWKKLGYTEQEYYEKLQDLKDGQYDAIEAYNDTKDAIVDLNKERIDAIKDGIQKEIDAYEELIEKKKEELDAEKDLHDFQKGVMDQQKEIADIERQLAALSADNSASARAKRAQLEAQLVEAQAELEETYYDRSVSDQQEALDKELEAFQKEKEAEIEGWEAYLENTELVVSDSLATVQANTGTVYQTLLAMGQEYGLSLTETLTSPWQEGAYALQSYSEQFGISMSKTVEELEALALKYKEIMQEIEGYGEEVVNKAETNANKYTEAKKKEPQKQLESNSNTENKKDEKTEEETKPSLTKGSYVEVKSGARWYANSYGGGASGTAKSGKIKYINEGSTHPYNIDGLGWIRKQDIKGYAKGSLGVDKDQLAWIDELGEELQLVPDGNGRLAYIKKGTGILNADITKNLMELGQLDPSEVLKRSTPSVGAPHIINNNIEVNMSIAEVVHIDTVENKDIPDLTKAIEKQMDKYMQNVNNSLRRFTR